MHSDPCSKVVGTNNLVHTLIKILYLKLCGMLLQFNTISSNQPSAEIKQRIFCCMIFLSFLHHLTLCKVRAEHCKILYSLIFRHSRL
jgi:hypothetical protein